VTGARLVAPLLAWAAVLAGPAAAQAPLRMESPDRRTVVTIAVEAGALTYAVARDGRQVVRPSRLGFAFRGASPLRDSVRIDGVARASRDTTWTQPWGETARVRDRHHEMRVTAVEQRAPGRRFTVVVRAFDDGIAFRYEVPRQPAMDSVAIEQELTEFAMAQDGRAWWIPSFRPNRYEYLYRASPLSTLDTVHTPLTIEAPEGLHVAIHEAHLVDYAAMNLRGGGEQERTLRVVLAPMADGVAVRTATPFETPWRTIQLADRAADLVPSVLGLNLNPPPAIDPAPYRPMTYNGVWWGMHVNTMTWSSGPQHGATTATTRRYLEFAAANRLGGTLVEGWNVGWDGDWVQNGDRFSFTQPYPDFDLPGLAAFARAKGITLIGHHETGMGIANYERQLDSAFALYARLGVRTVKTGYVGDRTREGHAHHSQPMVRHFRRVVETAARYGIALDVHEPIKDTGERRTFPNMMTREGARGQEYNAWGGDGGNPPEHETILFFTRMLAGPFDFTPGIFDVEIRRPTGAPRPPEAPRPRTTLAKQLALYVVLYSPLQMAADLPENYEGQPAFQFIRDVAVDWDTTRVLEGRIGDYVVVARKARGRDEWFLGAITDEAGRRFDMPLDFLPPGRWIAERYADAADAHYLRRPTAVTIDRLEVTAGTRLTLQLAPGGGQAIRFRRAD
jgi:alpha-glucosidase